MTKQELVESIKELLKECDDIDLLYFVESLLVTADLPLEAQ